MIGDRIHRFRRGEDLERLAKRWGHRGARPVWEHAENKGLRSKRKTHAALAPGDKIFKPLSRGELDAISREIDHYTRLHENVAVVHAGHVTAHIQMSTMAASLVSAIKSIEANLSAAESGLIAAYTRLRSAKLAEEIERVRAEIARDTSDAMRKIEALKKHVASETKILEALAGRDFEKAAKEAGAAAKPAQQVASGIKGLTSAAKSAVSKIHALVGDMTRPSFWLDMLASDSSGEVDPGIARTEAGRKILTAIGHLRKRRARVITHLRVLQKTAKVQATLNQAAMKSAEAELKGLQARLKSLPAPAELRKLSV